MIQLCAVTEDWTFFDIVISEVPMIWNRSESTGFPWIVHVNRNETPKDSIRKKKVYCLSRYFGYNCLVYIERKAWYLKHGY